MRKKMRKHLIFTVSAADRSAALRHGFRVGGSCGSRGRRKCCRRNSRSSRSDRNGRGIGRSGDGGTGGRSSAGLFLLGGGRSERSHRRGDWYRSIFRAAISSLSPGESWRSWTAYYVLWHEPEGTTMEEVWAGKDEYYAQRRADESTMDPEYYRSYAENVFTDINEEFFQPDVSVPLH